MEDATVTLAKSTLILLRDLLEKWINETEGQREVPRTAMRDWHRMNKEVS